MADSPLTKRLGMKPGFKALIVNAPDGFVASLDPLPESAVIHTSRNGTTIFDLVNVFVSSKADVDQHAPLALDAIKKGGWLWFTYPKKSSKIKTDVSRDLGWDAIHSAGWEGIAVISVDDTWSSMRFRPHEDIKSRNRSAARQP
jgi:hypothetical protein